MDKPLPLSVSLITLNEEANLPRCLESVAGLAAEVVIVDSGSTDRTEEIARQSGALFTRQPWQGFTRQKNVSLEQCTQPWVLCLDADEALSPELGQSIRRVLANDQPPTGYSVNRRTFYLGDWIWHCWYPEWRLRLTRRNQARWVGVDPHPSLEPTGNDKRLEGDLLHYPYDNFTDHLQQTLKYAEASALQWNSTGTLPGLGHLAFSPWAAFLKKLIVKQGWRDGWRGWVIAYATCLGVFAKYSYALEQQRKNARPSREQLRQK